MCIRDSFSTVFEYVHSLRALCEELGRHCGERAMAYLAAAVSDFYVPWAELPEHKIQSREEAPDDEDREASGVVLRLRRVPKMLGLVRSRWCPRAFVVGFKLETDPALLYRKASDSLRLYALHAVVANEMATRRDRAWAVTATVGDGTGRTGGTARAARCSAPRNVKHGPVDVAPAAHSKRTPEQTV